MWTQCWLDYKALNKDAYEKYFNTLYVDGFKKDDVISTASDELARASLAMFGRSLDIDISAPTKGIIIKKGSQDRLGSEGYHIYADGDIAYIEAGTPQAVIYGVFRFLALIRTDAFDDSTDVTEIPSNPIRMLDHWDNMDGSIERGYSGDSFFFENNDIIINERTRDYARLIASIGINAVAINNVNVKDAATDLVNQRFIDKVAKLADIFACYGVKLFLSLNYAMPIEYEPQSADPLDEKVIAWWKNKMKEVYDVIPNLGGFLVKADSEGRPGPFTYGRTQADGANMLAEAIKPYGGLIIWRCFVYNCKQDWRDLKTDRARAGYDYFSSLDGQFADNVILQIKNGPMDFQVREPVSPLFGGMRKTNQMLEVQIAQEYTGHQIDVCYLIPEFKEILGFKTYCSDDRDTVADIISGDTFESRYSGIAAVTTTGNDFNWTGHYLAGANLFGFGRLAFDTDLSSEEIAEEFVRMTISQDAEVVRTIVDILLPSREIYERYTSPLGIGWMVTPATHYGCSVDGYEYDRWGTYHRADHLGIGVDRTDKGTGYALLYNEPNASVYNDPDKCPDELVLFFHHLPYTHKLHSGKTVIQHIYDTHFEGYEEAQQLAEKWKSLKGKVSDEIFENVSERFERQLSNAREWCDQVNSYFFRKSGIPDEKGRQIW
ncbi:MAG: alpha-glucuronidase [Lachnospiraceae bacterium]|nr:alpha-glucuronidase [Lachnospiraceae bacterium]